MFERRWAPATLLGLVIAAGTFFRFYHLEEKLLWHDEVATRVFAAGYTIPEWKKELFTGRIFTVDEVQRYQRPTPGRSVAPGIEGMARDDPQHPPLYYVLAAVWVSVLGGSVATLRALGVVFSLLTLPAVFWLCRELGGSRRVAATGVALAALNPFFVLYAQEAREYALWTLLIVLSNASLLRAIRLTEAGDRRLARAWGPYALCTVISLYTSFSTAAVLLAQILYLLVRERLRPTRVAVSAVAALTVSGLAFLPWFLNLLREYEAFEISMRWSKIIIIPRASLLRLLALNTSRTLIDFWPDATDALSYAGVLAAVSLVVTSLVALARRTPARSSLLILALVLVPIAMLLGPDLVLGGIRSISMRYLTPAWVGTLVAVAFFLGSMRTQLVSAVVLVLSFASCWVNGERVAVWTKSVSVRLPDVAAAVNASPAPLVVGNLERFNPANMLALSRLLDPSAKMQFLTTSAEEHYVLPRGYDVFLFTPINEYREAMEQREGVKSRLLLRDDFLELWHVERGP